MSRSFAITAAALLVAACTGGSGGPAPAPEQPAVAVAEPARSGVAGPKEVAEEAVFVSTPAVEQGFTHCCGTLDYKMEVECGDRLKRCYIQEDGQWKQTYGRHCKRNLGDSCYLHLCDDACSN